MQAVSALGLDAGVQLEVQLCKLLIHEVGGHFTFNRYPEKEKGIVASFILQFPTEEGYTAGELVVKHKKKVKKFEGQMVSAIGFCYTIFLAGCHHAVWKIKSGTRICLAFNLMRCGSSFDSIDEKSTPDRLKKVEAALEPWLEEVTKSRPKVFGRIIYIPLQHKYTEELLSFSGLKGEDSNAAELLKECKDRSGKQWLDIHLCLATKFKYGVPACTCNHRTDDDFGEEDFRTRDFNTKCWIGSDGSRVPFDLVLDMKTELVVGEEEDPFDSEPYKEEYIGDPRTWYHTTMLVAWPRADSFLVACNESASRALEILEGMYEAGDSEFCKTLNEFLRFCNLNTFLVWGHPRDSKDDNVTPKLLNLCTRAKVKWEVKQCLYSLCSKLCYEDGKASAYRLGMRNADVAKAVADIVKVFGWEKMSSPIMNLAEICGSTQSESFAQLVEQLKSMGQTNAGALVANTVSRVLRARIRELELQKMPEFSWCQPLAKFSAKLEIENFLRGPEENTICYGFPSLPKARSFCERYFRGRASCGYSAVGFPGGRGREAHCEIQKTRHLFSVSLDQWQENQTLKETLRLDLGKFDSAVG